jgi:hypothetical protein
MSSILIDEQRPWFSQRYNKECFRFNHRLHENELFDLPNLVELAGRLPDSYWSTADAAVAGGWGGGDERRSLRETVASIAESNSLVLLKGLAQDPLFGSVYERMIGELKECVGDAFKADISVGRATLIISSPERVTPYHIDGEVNFLLQIRGSKTVNIFDPNDRTLLTEAELENFYGGDSSAATYKEDRQKDAFAFDFQPGDGVHVPLHAPHWTKNGAAVSVALSINCTLRSSARTAQIYRLNRLLRQRGVTPAPPGASAWQDRIKVAVGAGVERARVLARR